MDTLKLDVLFFAAHPDDVELAAAGTVCKWTAAGKKVGIVDLTRGELGTRGSAELRDKEAEVSARIMGLSARENLGFRDGFFELDEAHLLSVIQMIRRFRPEILIANALADRHPDHGRAAQLIKRAHFLSGLIRIETTDKGEPQPAWRAKQLFHYIQSDFMEPDFVVDVTDYFELRMKAIKAFASQFYDPDSKEPQTFISSENFWKFLSGRAREYGQKIGATYGEGFLSERALKIDDPLSLA